jgi:hypothetical protein
MENIDIIPLVTNWEQRVTASVVSIGNSVLRFIGINAEIVVLNGEWIANTFKFINHAMEMVYLDAKIRGKIFDFINFILDNKGKIFLFSFIVGVFAGVNVYNRRNRRNLILDLNANRQQVKNALNVRKNAREHLRVDVINPPMLDPQGAIIQEPRNVATPLANYVRDGEFLKINDNKYNAICDTPMCSFSYAEPKFYRTPVDNRARFNYNWCKFLVDAFSGMKIKTDIEYVETRENINLQLDVRPDSNSTGKVLHWCGNIDYFVQRDYNIIYKNDNYSWILERIIDYLPIWYASNLKYVLYNSDYVFDLQIIEKRLHINPELVKNNASLKTLNENSKPSQALQTIQLSIQNSSSTNVSRNLICDGQYVFNDSANMLLHLFMRRCFNESIHLRDESVFQL